MVAAAAAAAAVPEAEICSPSFDQMIVNGGSPFSTMQVTWARRPSDRSFLKLKGAIVGGTAQKKREKQVTVSMNVNEFYPDGSSCYRCS